MALIKPIALIESMRKKVCMHSDVYFRTNKQTGKTFTGKLCYPSNHFAKVVAAVRAILADPTEKAKLKAEFKSQTKIGSLFGYAMHKLNSQYDQNGDKIGG